MQRPTKSFLFKELPRTFFFSFSIFAALLAAGTVVAFTGPQTLPPPGCVSGNPGCDAPLNVSGNAQVKAGGLLLNTGGAADGLIVQSGNVGIDDSSPLWPLGVNGASNSWAEVINWFDGAGPPTTGQYYGILVGTGPNGFSQFQNGIGPVPTYALLADQQYGLNSNGAVNAVGNAGTWAGFFSNPSGSYGLQAQNGTGSSVIYAQLAFGGYGLNTNGAVSAVGNAGTWAGVFTNPSGTYGVQAGPNNSNVYSQIAYGAYGLYTNGQVNANAFYYNSDRRLKKNIAPIASSTALADVLALVPVTFNWIDPKSPTTTQIGFIAQDVQKVVPEIVTTDASTTMEAVDYARVAPLLVGAVQAQQKEIETLMQTNADQQEEIDVLKSEVSAGH